MKQNCKKMNSNILFYTLISLLLFYSCSTLQKQKGYEDYTKNTYWKNK